MNTYLSLLRRPHPNVRFGFSWLAVIPAGVWAISTIYIPLFSDNLGRAENWAITLVISLLIGLSVLGHILAHLYAARLVKISAPVELRILVYGDAAQCWPPVDSTGKEAVAASAGPIANLLLSGLAYLVWNAQIGVFSNLVSLFLCVFNLWMLAVNLLPAFPMDGGRLLRAWLRGPITLIISLSISLTAWIRRLGFAFCILLAGWGIFLFLQHSRFSLETAGLALAVLLLLLDGLRIPPALDPAASAIQQGGRFRLLRLAAAGLLAFVMLGTFACTLMTNDGVDAPGVALSVEPMVKVPPQYRHAHTGTFMLTTVFSHAPILLGEWLLARVDPAITILPPEVVVPRNTTVQEQARQDYQMLDESEAAAITVGLRLAGYESDMLGKGVQVASFLPGSPANGILRVGDVITALNGQPVRTTDDLIRMVKAQTREAAVQLDVQRDQAKMVLTVPLMPPDAASSSPHIGISIQSAGFDFKPPFPVSIETQKINGGPSAGLMFTLTVYNALSSQDLTGGRKIAGTGTISLDGTVGPIGGVKQKVAAAEATGALYFLCPVDNYPDAVSVARTIKVIEVANIQDALNFLHQLRQ